MNYVNNQSEKKVSVRNSNLELLRIITMLLIVAHHYVVNSGLLDVNGPIQMNLLAPKSLFLLVFGAWGKIGINAFVLITGYFMCTSRITMRKYIKLLAEVMFYKIIIYFIFVLSGYQAISIKELVFAFLPITSIGQGFTACFLIFYLCIPFINVLIKHLSEKQHIYLLLLLLFTYTFFGTIKFLPVQMNYVSWFLVIYLIASYIRLYPKDLFSNLIFWKWATISTFVVSSCSVIVGALVSPILERDMTHFFVSDSNTFLAVITSLSAFMFFKNIEIKSNKIINTVAASAFGVLMIHANSDVMRRWLWKDVLHNVEVYSTEYLVPHAIISVIAIYVICTIIDYIRIYTVERWFFAIYDKYEGKIILTFKEVESKICKKFHIKE